MLIGGIEALGLLEDHLGLSGGFWKLLAQLNGNFNSLGFIIIGLFIADWIGSILIYRYCGYEHVEIKAAGPQYAQK